jgi:hypothetical protein
LLGDVTAVAETMCLPSRFLATAVSLASLFCLSGVLSRYVFFVFWCFKLLLICFLV